MSAQQKAALEAVFAWQLRKGDVIMLAPEYTDGFEPAVCTVVETPYTASLSKTVWVAIVPQRPGSGITAAQPWRQPFAQTVKVWRVKGGAA
jgi:hypothetical protein